MSKRGAVSTGKIITSRQCSKVRTFFEPRAKTGSRVVALLYRRQCVNDLQRLSIRQARWGTKSNDLTKIIQNFDEFAIGELNETFQRYIYWNHWTGKWNHRWKYLCHYTSHMYTRKNMQFFWLHACFDHSWQDCPKRSWLITRKPRKRLLQERNLTLSKCIDLCKSFETTNL